MLGGDFKLIASHPEVGSTFEVTVRIGIPEPVQYFKAASGRTTADKDRAIVERNGILTGLNILVAEDSIDNQELMRLMLSRAGAKVQIASDGYEAIEKAECGEFSVILMDIQMPHMDGHEATKVLRNNGYEGSIIALTAHAMKEEREKCSISGFTGYLTKPVQWSVLFQTLAQLSSVSPPLPS
jgi:CheY-like chemotaxis protein